MLLGLAAALFAAVLYGVAAILQATGSRQVATSNGLDPRTALALLRRPAYLGALSMTLLGFGFHLAAVRLVPLFLAQAGIAVSLVVTALLAVRLFGDRLSALEWTAVAAVGAGLVLLSAAAGDVGTQRGTGWLSAGLFAVLALMVVVGMLVGRRTGAVVTAILGLTGGMGYAVVGVASRLLPDDLAPADLLTSSTTYALAAGGTLAFFMYSLALQRGSAVAATTPLIVTQTIVPAAVGVIALGDQVRPGWWPAAMIGFVVTAGAAVVLVRFEGVRARDVAEDLVSR